MTEESHDPQIDPALEARIVALLLGEASDFERDELNHLIAARPELAAFKKQMESVHGSLRDVASGESPVEDDDWKLPAEKRSVLLAVLSGEATGQPGEPVVLKTAVVPIPTTAKWTWSFSKIAAMFCVVGFFGIMAILGAFDTVVARRAATGLSRMVGAASDAEISAQSMRASKRLQGGTGLSYTFENGDAIDVGGEVAGVTEFSALPRMATEQQSKSSLSGIRDSLGASTALPSAYYLSDDVQYFSTDLPSAASAPPQNRSAGDRGYFAPDRWGTAESSSVRSIVTPLASIDVPDVGAGLRGGIAQTKEDRPERRLRRGQTPSSPPTADGNSDSVAAVETWEIRSRDLNALGFSDRPAMEEVEELEDLFGLALGGENKMFSEQNRSVGRSITGPSFAPKTSDPEPELAQRKSQQSGEAIDDLFSAAPGDSAIARVDTPFGGAQLEADMEMEMGMAMGMAMNDPFGEDPFDDDNDPFGEDPFDDDMVGGMGMGIGMGTAGSMGGGGLGGGRDESSPEKNAIQNNINEMLQLLEGDAAKQTAPPTSIASSSAGKAEKEVAERPLGLEAADVRGRTKSLARPNDQPIPTNKDLLSRGEVAANESPSELFKNGIDSSSKNDRFARSSDLSLGPQSTNGLLLGLLPDARAGRARGKRLDARLEDLQAVQADNWYGRQFDSKTNAAGYEFLKKGLSNKRMAPAGLDEKNAEEDAFSTFSLHVSDVSFKLAQAALAHGEWPEAAKVRVEEFVNAFDYGDPMPSQSEKVACRVEQSIHPFLQQRNLLRVSMRTAAAGRSSNTPLRLTLLLDNSGSMERADRRQTVRRAFALLAQQLKPIDQVTLISFARQPRLLADKVSGAQSSQLVSLIEDLPSEGGTNIEAALRLAFEKAREQQVEGAQNRVILLTDGAVNLGDANPASLSRMITTMRDAGIAFDAAGISADGLNDEVLEALSRQGDGRYYLLDSPESADDGFARQIAGSLRPSAKNVKVQIEFNPQRVGRYKLLGYEKHRLKKEDFRNDTVDAAEMAAAETGVAVYQFEAKPDGEGDVGSVSVRFRDLDTGQMVESRWPIPYDADAPRPDQAAPSLRIATSAALLAAKLRGEPLGETVDLQTLSRLVAGLPQRYRNAHRIQQLQLMIQQARQVSGN